MTFAWTPGEYLSDSTIQSPIATPLIATYYCVAATDSSLCTIEVCQEVKVGIPPARIAIPSAFSPNGDNKNDTYYILTSNGTIIASLKIYDRKGILIFDNTTGQSWDGTYRGAPQPQGTYVCFITYYQELYPDNLFYKEASFDLFR